MNVSDTKYVWRIFFCFYFYPLAFFIFCLNAPVRLPNMKEFLLSQVTAVQPLCEPTLSLGLNNALITFINIVHSQSFEQIQ